MDAVVESFESPFGSEEQRLEHEVHSSEQNAESMTDVEGWKAGGVDLERGEFDEEYECVVVR